MSFQIWKSGQRELFQALSPKAAITPIVTNISKAVIRRMESVCESGSFFLVLRAKRYRYLHKMMKLVQTKRFIHMSSKNKETSCFANAFARVNIEVISTTAYAVAGDKNNIQTWLIIQLQFNWLAAIWFMSYTRVNMTPMVTKIMVEVIS